MKIRNTTAKRRGSVLLAILAIIAIAAIVWLGWKIIKKLKDSPIGNPDRYTNVVDSAWSPRMTALLATYSNELVTLPQLGITVPLEALQYQWWERVESSTNLCDWTPTTLDWNEALELVRTNHSEPSRFYRRQIVW